MKKDRQCKYCKVIFENIEGRVFANHVRWCDKNTTNGDKGCSKLSTATKNHYEKINGKKRLFTVKCEKCSITFKVEECEHKFPMKEKYYCSRSCANSREWTDEVNVKRAKSNSKSSKRLWEDIEYVEKMMTVNTRFTSKIEREIREHFRKTFPKDEWTFGGAVKIDDILISRDLYSKKLKVCFEYDGIWHFKDIKGQLADKQQKDAALEKWCEENGYRLIRMSESFYYENENSIKLLEELVYSNNEDLIKLGNEYNGSKKPV
jgi:very-short-patch-repair endonuclease